MKREIINDPKELFRRWYKVPLKILEGIPRGDGGWIALATSCFLFERYVSVKHKIENGKSKIKKEDIYEQLVTDFNTDHNTAKKF